MMLCPTAVEVMSAHIGKHVCLLLISMSSQIIISQRDRILEEFILADKMSNTKRAQASPFLFDNIYIQTQQLAIELIMRETDLLLPAEFTEYKPNKPFLYIFNPVNMHLTVRVPNYWVEFKIISHLENRKMQDEIESIFV